MLAPLPLTSVCGSDVRSHIFTVRSNEPDATIDPNSGCAQVSLETAASCALQKFQMQM
jgi:hypothetical protein